MLRRAGLALLLLFLAIEVSSLPLKLGSIVPRGSPWELALKRVGAEWLALSGGSVELKLYPGGIAGDEPDLVRKIRIGQLQAGLLTMVGLQTIWNGLKALSYPLFIRDEPEFERVLAGLRPRFERELEARGFKVVLWSPGGWMYFFTRYPVATPDDLRKQKIWVTGNPDELQAWHATGFQVVILPTTDVLTGLQTGMIDGIITSPLVAASNQWFSVASHMLGLKLSPLFGAVVLSTKSWSELPEELRPQLLEAAERVSASLEPAIAKADEEAIAVMRKHGLVVTEVGSGERAEWEEVIQQGFSMLVGTAYDASSLEAARMLIDDFRRNTAR